MLLPSLSPSLSRPPPALARDPFELRALKRSSRNACRALSTFAAEFGFELVVLAGAGELALAGVAATEFALLVVALAVELEPVPVLAFAAEVAPFVEELVAGLAPPEVRPS